MELQTENQTEKFRQNVAALLHYKDKYLGCYRACYDSWQTVQGGIEDFDLSPREAMIREMKEELFLDKNNYQIHYQSKYWRRYRFTNNILKRQKKNNYIGQEQMWFLVELFSVDDIDLKKFQSEFDKVELFSFSDFYAKYSPWKKAPFADFCLEVNLTHE